MWRRAPRWSVQWIYFTIGDSSDESLILKCILKNTTRSNISPSCDIFSAHGANALWSRHYFQFVNAAFFYAADLAYSLDRFSSQDKTVRKSKP